MQRHPYFISHFQCTDRTPTIFVWVVCQSLDLPSLPWQTKSDICIAELHPSITHGICGIWWFRERITPTLPRHIRPTGRCYGSMLMLQVAFQRHDHSFNLHVYKSLARHQTVLKITSMSNIVTFGGWTSSVGKKALCVYMRSEVSLVLKQGRFTISCLWKRGCGTQEAGQQASMISQLLGETPL